MDNKKVKMLLYDLWVLRKELESIKAPDIKEHLRERITSITNELYELHIPYELPFKVIKLAIEGTPIEESLDVLLRSIDIEKMPRFKKGTLKISYLNEFNKSDKTGKVKLLEFQGIDGPWEWWIVKNLDTNMTYSYGFYIPGRIK